MDQSSYALIQSTIEVMKALYKYQINELNQKLKNIDYINTDILVSKIEEEIKEEDLSKNYEKMVSIIESIIQD